jgi:hypothetical protein
VSQPEGLSLAIAQAWFENLPAIPQAFALLDLPKGEDVVVIAGVVAYTMTHEEAEALIRGGEVRIAPVDPTGRRKGCPLVVLDPKTGFPLLIEASRRSPYGKERP